MGYKKRTYCGLLPRNRVLYSRDMHHLRERRWNAEGQVRCNMIRSLRMQLQNKNRSAFGVNPGGRFEEIDLNRVIFIRQKVGGLATHLLRGFKVSYGLGFVLLFLIGFFVTSSYAENAGVTLPELESRVLKNSPLIQKRIEGIGETKAKIDSLDRDYGFYLRSNYRYNLKNSLGTQDLPSDFRYRGDVDIEWELSRAGLFGNTGARNSLNRMSEALQLELKQTEADELAVVRIFFFNALKEKRLGDGDRSALAFKEQVFKEVEDLYKKREILYSESLKVRQEVERLRSSERQHERDYSRFINAIAWRTGISGELRLLASGEMPPSLSLEQIKGRLDSNYLLKSLELKRQSVEAEPVASTLLALSLFGGYTFDESTDSAFRDGVHVGVRLTVPLTIFGKAKAVKNEIEHRARGVSFEYKDVQQDINRQVDRLYIDFLSDLDLLKLEEQNLLLIDEDIRLMEEYLKNPIQNIKFSNLDLLHKKAEKAVSQAKIEAKQYDLWSDYYKLYKFMEDRR
jgi:outer membrane protein TolC